jgi:hypothetical protein
MKRHFQTKSMMAPKKRKSPAPKTRGGQSGGGNPNNNDRGITETQHDDAMRVLRAEYYQGVRGLAQEVAERVKDEGGDQHDILHEVVDGSYWVIYTHANFQVLMCSDHHDAYSEEFGEAPVSGADINWAALAYATLARDVSDQVGAEGLEEAPRGRSAHSTRSTREVRPGSRAARRGR